MLDHTEPASRTEELPRDLAELLAAIAKLPPEQRLQIDRLLTRVVNNTRYRRRTLQLVQEALSQLRLDMKYLMFDLEATRREREAFREQLERTGE